MKIECPLLEQLEPRIAPAVLVHGANLLGGADNPSTGETSIGEDAALAVKVTGGMAIVWYDALQGGGIMGISVSNGANLEIFGDVNGDIVANLTSEGRLSDSDMDPTNGESGDVLLANSIAGIKINKTPSQEGNVHNIITAGNIANVRVDGKINGIYAGDGVFDSLSDLGADGTFTIGVGDDPDDASHMPLDINPLDGITGDERGNFNFSLANQVTSGKNGSSIANVFITSGIGLQIIAGDGVAGTGGAGGNITNVTIDSAAIEEGGSISYLIVAGDGADGLIGGNGGSITTVIEKASSQGVLLQAGDGGQGTVGGGGHGGTISKVNAQSDQSSYSVSAGTGGEGNTFGGNGGSLLQNNFSGRDPKTGILVSGDFNGDDREDFIIVDSGSGQMVLMENKNGGAEFAAVVQDPGENEESPDDDIILIQAVGVTPKTAITTDIDGDGDLDLLVAYGNSASIGVFLNDSHGVFTSSSFSTGLSPVDIAVGNFLSDSSKDIAILANTSAGAVLLIAQNDGVGAFSLNDKTVSLGKTKGALDLIAAKVNTGNLDDLFIGYENGQITTAFATGSTATLFSDMSTIGSTSKLSNLDIDLATEKLLAFNSQGKAITLFDYSSGSLVKEGVGPDLTLQGGQALVARFGGESGNIQVLTVQSGSSKITEYAPGSVDPVTGLSGYGVSKVLSSEDTLKTFISTNEGDGVAALAGSLSRMVYNAGTGFQEVNLPFTGKTLEAFAGDGGLAHNGKGGNGGVITALNAEATDISVQTGSGGSSLLGAGGNGGALTNSGTVSVAGGGSVSATLIADALLDIRIGSGGEGAGTGIGGNGGAISGLTATLNAGTFTLSTGDGGAADFGNGGNGGNASGLNLKNKGGDFDLVLGDGGISANGKQGGNGGSVLAFKYTQELEAELDALGLSYSMEILAGAGGAATVGKGGTGGSLSTLNITVDPSDNADLTFDNTTRVILIAGDGGDGATGGGAGGSITSTNLFVTHDELEIVADDPTGSSAAINYAVLEVRAGNGGAGGVAGNGGAGGSVTNLKPKGITMFAPAAEEYGGTLLDYGALRVLAGAGGDGGLMGGKGGSLTNITSSNASLDDGTIVLLRNMLTSAVLIAGDGGDGEQKDAGAGGTISNTTIGVEARGVGGGIAVFAGEGGDSTFGKGGAGGSIISGTYSTVRVETYEFITVDSIWLIAGNGGEGLLLGGAGGSLASFSVNSPQQQGIYGAILTAGDGGDATSTLDAKSKGGAGGSITSIKKQKDLNSFMSLLRAGDGGDAIAGSGGIGGSVSSISTAGFIGRPTDDAEGRLGLYHDGQLQGIFAGNGGDSDTGIDGLAGSITSIVARQIAAMGANMRPDGTFGLASKISGIRADVIGYDADGLGYTGPQSPSEQAPVDGFLLAKVIADIKTYNPSITAGFTFIE